MMQYDIASPFSCFISDRRVAVVATAMINTAAIFVLVVFMFGLSGCNVNKTIILIGKLDSNLTTKELTGLGVDLAYEVAKNSSMFKDFFKNYEITFKPLVTNVSL